MGRIWVGCNGPGRTSTSSRMRMHGSFLVGERALASRKASTFCVAFSRSRLAAGPGASYEKRS